MNEEKKEYYPRYNDIYNMILRAYSDLYIMQTIEKDETPLYKDSSYVLSHINELLKCDFALTIWKISIDTKSNANTIQHLHSYLRRKKSDRPTFSMTESLKADITNIRKKYLAHNDFVKSGVTLQIAPLSEILNELKNWLNLLYDPTIDRRVEKITDEDLQRMERNTEIGLKRLLLGNDI